MNVVTLNTFVVLPAHVPSIFPPPRLGPSFQNICKCWPLFYHLVQFLSRKHLHFQALSSRISETIQPGIETPRRGNAQSDASSPGSLSEERRRFLSVYAGRATEASVSSTSPKQLRPLEANLSFDNGSC